MDIATPHPLSAQVAAALDWWRDAGVETDCDDSPAGWLNEPDTVRPHGESPAAQAPAKAAPPAAPLEKPIAGPHAEWPRDLAGFARWWMEAAELEFGGTGARIPPRGAAGSRLMVLVAMPEEEDSDQLLSGPQGHYLAAVLGALGVAAQDCYFASPLPRHVPAADFHALARAGLGDLLRHHLALAAPRRVVAFGANLLPLLGHDPAQDAQSLPPFNHDSGEIPIFPARRLDVLLARPQERARFWRRWLEWTGTDDW